MPDSAQPQFTQFGAFLGASCERFDYLPTISFITPGDLVVAYSLQLGTVDRVGNRLFVDFSLQTSTFTFTTAVGALRIAGLLPFVNASDGIQKSGSLQFSGITKAGYTNFVLNGNVGSSTLGITASTSAGAISGVVAADMPSGGTVILRGSIVIRVPQQ